MNARVVAPARGAHWLAAGWSMFRAAPLGWLVLVFAYLMATTLMSVFPVVGPAAVSLLVPAFSVGFMAASRAAAHRQPVELPMLFAGFRERLPGQLVLGCVYSAGFAAAIAGSALVDGGALLQALFDPAQARDDAGQGDRLFVGMLASAVLYLPTMMMLWFAPVLVAWHGLGPGKAVFYSLVAFWMNRLAFIAYALVLAVVLFLAMGSVILLASLMPGEAPALNPRSLVFPLALIVLPTLFASYYASYEDVFGAPEQA
ncbi:MAG: BPSS1780 family membrane protein [Betaproteobacteria bacterium]|nr:BPSS1780 family membrane protein [Betaproteobacteria bacterium]